VKELGGSVKKKKSPSTGSFLLEPSKKKYIKGKFSRLLYRIEFFLILSNADCFLNAISMTCLACVLIQGAFDQEATE